MLKTGQKELHDGAKDEMAQALRVMGQAAQMTKDPTFQEQPEEHMANAFKSQL